MDSKRIGKFIADLLRIFSMFYIVRSCCIWVTLLPGPAPHCRPGGSFRPPQEYFVLNFVWSPVGLTSSATCPWTAFPLRRAGIWFPRGISGLLLSHWWQFWESCLDGSCHVAFGRNLNVDRKNFVLGCFLYELITGYFIIATRKHYTVDVVVGFFLSFFMSILRFLFSVERSSSKMGGSPPCSEMKIPIFLYPWIVRFDHFGCVCWKRREMLVTQRMNENEVQVAFSPLKEDSPASKKYSLTFNFKRRKIVPLSDTQLLSPPKVFYFKSKANC